MHARQGTSKGGATAKPDVDGFDSAMEEVAAASHAATDAASEPAMPPTSAAADAAADAASEPAVPPASSGGNSIYAICQAFARGEAVLPVDFERPQMAANSHVPSAAPARVPTPWAFAPRARTIEFNVGHEVHTYATEEDELSGSDADMVRAEDFADRYVVIDLTSPG